MNTFPVRLAAIEAALERLETRVREDADAPLESVLEPAVAAVRDAMRACVAARGRNAEPAGDADILDAWQALVKGDPTWNAIRDNCRELVYYRNCLASGRRDALPAAPARMAVRTARHVCLYIRTRAAREGWNDDA